MRYDTTNMNVNSDSVRSEWSVCSQESAGQYNNECNVPSVWSVCGEECKYTVVTAVNAVCGVL